MALLLRVTLMLLSKGMKFCWGWGCGFDSNLSEFCMGILIAGITIFCGEGETLFFSP
jgi:hypothetical protein